MDVEAGDPPTAGQEQVIIDRDSGNGNGGDVGGAVRERRLSVGSVVGRTESVPVVGQTPEDEDDEDDERDERQEEDERQDNRYKTNYAVHLISVEDKGLQSCVLKSDGGRLQNVSALLGTVKSEIKSIEERERQRRVHLQQGNKRVIDINRYTIHVRYKLVSHHLDTIIKRINGLQPNWDVCVHSEAVRKTGGAQTGGGAVASVKANPPPLVSYRIEGRFSGGGECNLILETAVGTKLGEKMCLIAFNEVKSFLDSYAKEGALASPKTSYETEVDMQDIFRLVREFDSHLHEDTSHYYYMHPFIDAKKHAVLIAFDRLRAILMANKLFLIFPEQKGGSREERLRDAAETVERVRVDIERKADRELEEKDEGHSSPPPHVCKYANFDAQSLYAVLREVQYALMLPQVRRLEEAATETYSGFKEARYRVSSDDLEACLKLRNRVDKHLQEFSAHKQVLDEAIKDSIMMNVTFLAEHPEMYESGYVTRDALHQFDKGNIEYQLYDSETNWFAMESKLLSIQSELADIIQHVDTAKNDEQTVVLVVNTAVTILSACISFSGYVTGAFGMNLDQTVCPGEYCLQTTAGTFQGVCVGTLIFICAGAPIFVLLLQFFGFLPSAFRKNGGVWCSLCYYCRRDPVQSTKNTATADADSKLVADTDDSHYRTTTPDTTIRSRFAP